LTKEQAGIAYMYDRAAIDKSSEEVSTKQKKKFVSKVIRSRILKNYLYRYSV
jgi:hypothetical protein